MAVRKKLMPEISMVDITPKKSVHRIAVAEGSISLSGKSIRAIRDGSAKGDVLAVAEIAGINAEGDFLRGGFPVLMDCQTIPPFSS